MSVKEMYVIPKEVYHTIMSELSENKKRLVDSINVDQVNLSCGPLFAGVKNGDNEEKKEKEEEEEEKIEEKTAEEREDDKMRSADTPIQLYEFGLIKGRYFPAKTMPVKLCYP